jgi:hypothetical protein
MFKYTETDVTPKNVFLFGCGGTGSRTISPLIQLLKAQSNWLLNPNIYLIDGDIVESKNCARQNFIPADVGKNKAEVLATRYSKAFDTKISFYPFFFDKDRKQLFKRDSFRTFTPHNLSHFRAEFLKNHSKSIVGQGEDYDLAKMTGFLCGSETLTLTESLIRNAYAEYAKPGSVLSQGSANIDGTKPGSFSNEALLKAKSICFDPCVVILCVDSAEARRNILVSMTALHPNRKMFVIDAGNEDIFGQVMFYRFDHRLALHDTGFRQRILSEACGQALPALVGTSLCNLLTDKKDKEARKKIETNGLPFMFGHLVEVGESDGVPRLQRDGISIGSAYMDKFKAAGGQAYKDLLKTGDFTLDLIGENLPNMGGVDAVLPILPCPDLFYDTLEDGTGTGSCADLDQTLAINNLMAGGIINIVNNLVYGLAFDFHTIRISLNGGYNAEKMTPYWLKQVLTGRDPNYSNYLSRSMFETLFSPNSVSRDKAEGMIISYATEAFSKAEYRKHSISTDEATIFTQRFAIRRQLNNLSPDNKSLSEVVGLLASIDARCVQGSDRDVSCIELPEYKDYLERLPGILSKMSNEQIEVVIRVMFFQEHSLGHSEKRYSGAWVASPTGAMIEGLSILGSLQGMDTFFISTFIDHYRLSTDSLLRKRLSEFMVNSVLEGDVPLEALYEYEGRPENKSSSPKVSLSRQKPTELSSGFGPDILFTAPDPRLNTDREREIHEAREILDGLR